MMIEKSMLIATLGLMVLSFVFSRFLSVVSLIRWGKLLLNLSFLLGLLSFLRSLINSTGCFPFEWSFGFNIFLFDKISILFYLMVSIIGWVIISFSKNYLWGDSLHKVFIMRLLFTIAVVQLMVLSGDFILIFLFWFLSDVGLRSLIGLYQNRKYALVAQAKKKKMSILSNIFMIVGFFLLFVDKESMNLIKLFDASNKLTGSTLLLEIACSSLALSAIIKSANIPFYGWLLGIMETPTPVSALLHAGLLNAGPFLMIRFYPLIDKATSAQIILILWGGFSALFGTLVSYFQPAVKTRLSYSSVGHMGFSLMLSGLGLYSAALLHLVGHSFYKAHAFLSSGSEIDKQRIIQNRNIRIFPISPPAILLAFICGIVFYAVFLMIFKKTLFPDISFLMLGIIIAISVSVFISNTIYFVRYWRGFVNVLGFVVTVFVSFFLLEMAAEYIVPSLTGGSIHLVKIVSISILIVLFVILAIYSIALKWGFIEPIPVWDVYVRNGFYLHIFLDKLFTNSKLKIHESGK